MIDLKPVITVSAVMLLLNACDSVIDPNIVDFSEIYAAAHLGIDAGLDGTYTTGCYSGGPGTVKEDLRIRGNTWNYTNTEYASIDCSTVLTVGTISGTFNIDGSDISTTGWVIDGGGTGTAPLTADTTDAPTFTLSTIEPVTPLLLTISGATGSLAATSGTTSFFYVVDDTGEDNVLYRDWDFDGGAAIVAGNFAPFKETNVDLSEIFVAAHSTTAAGLNGTYNTACYPGGGSYINDDLVILGNTWDYTKTVYLSSACTTVDTVGTISGTFNIDGTDISTTGWVIDGGGSGTAPLTADTTDAPTFTLSTIEPVTPLLLTISSATGSLFGSSGTSSFFFVVDDTGVNNVLYRDWDFDGGATTAGDFNPYTKQ